MNKKAMSIMIALLSISGVGTAVLAQKQILTPGEPTYPIQENAEIKFAEGVAFDKNSHTADQAAFLIMKYNGRESIYLIIGDTVYKMAKVTNTTSKLGSGTTVFEYKSEDGSVLTILTQRFEQWGQMSVSGDFKNYLITFKPMYYYDYYPIATPAYAESSTSNPGVGKISKDDRSEFIQETRPVMKGLQDIANMEEVNISALKKSATPMENWSD